MVKNFFLVFLKWSSQVSYWFYFLNVFWFKINSYIFEQHFSSLVLSLVLLYLLMDHFTSNFKDIWNKKLPHHLQFFFDNAILLWSRLSPILGNIIFILGTFFCFSRFSFIFWSAHNSNNNRCHCPYWYYSMIAMTTTNTTTPANYHHQKLTLLKLFFISRPCITQNSISKKKKKNPIQKIQEMFT